MLRSFLVSLALITTTAALAEDSPGSSPSAPAPPAAPATPAAPAAPAEPAKPADPLAEPKELVETQANTKANLQKAIDLYDKALVDASIPQKDREAGYADQSRAYLRLGDLETADQKKIDIYTKGRAAAQKGLALNPNCAECIYWDMANQAVIGRTKGVMNSLFMLGDLRKGLNRVLELQPGHKRAKETLAKIDHAVPGLAGGSDDRAEKAYKEILTRDPHFTPAMASIAIFYKDKGNKDEAKSWAEKCVAEKASSAPNDYRKFDKKDCEQVLKDIGG